MRYGGEDTPATSDDVPDDESVLTPLPSEYGDEDERQHKPIDIDEVKASVESLRQYLAAIQPSQEVEFQPDFLRPGVQDDGEINKYSYERTGVTHLTHSWHAQGHERPTVGLVPSHRLKQLTLLIGRILSSLHLTCAEAPSALAVRWYFRATAEVAQTLGAYFSVAFPAEYEKYRRAFDAGVWLTEDPGPWLGRAIVYKLQVEHHQDKSDGGPTAIFNIGQYTGGELYLTSLGLKFS